MTEPHIEAAVTLMIKHLDGPVIADPDHVRRWLTADGSYFDGTFNGFDYGVCPDHPDPDECDGGEAMSIYRATIDSATWDTENEGS